MRIRKITTIRDLENIVDTWSGSEGLATKTLTHEQGVTNVARYIADRRPDDLNYGDDWSEYLATVGDIWDIADAVN